MATADVDTTIDSCQSGDETPSCLAGSVGWLLSQAHFALAHQMTRALADLGISPRAYHVLMAARTGEWTQGELAEAVGLDKTTMVVTLDELEAGGLAERRPAAHDRRARMITVTRAGARLAGRAEQVVLQVQADVLAPLGSEGSEAFLRSLTALVGTTLAEPAGCGPVRRKQPKV